MSVEKKSLISNLKTTKKANIAKTDLKPRSVTSKAVVQPKRQRMSRADATTLKRSPA